MKLKGRTKELHVSWLSPPKQHVPESLILLNQLSHGFEPLFGLLAFRYGKDPLLGTLSLFKCWVFYMRRKAEEPGGLWTLFLVLGSKFHLYVLMKLIRTKSQSPNTKLTLAAKLLLPIQVVAWSLCNVESSVLGVAARALFLALRNLFYTSIEAMANRFLGGAEKSKIFAALLGPRKAPQHRSEITATYIEACLVQTGLIKSEGERTEEPSKEEALRAINSEGSWDLTRAPNMKSDARVDSIRVTSLDESLESNEIEDEDVQIDNTFEILTTEKSPKKPPQGFMGETVRVHIQYRGGDAMDELPSTVVCKFAIQDAKIRITCALVALYLREVQFYNQIAPRLRDWDSKNKAMMLQVPKTFGLDYCDQNGACVLVMEDLAPLVPGDELIGASWQQACSVALRYARFHALHWSSSLQQLNEKHVLKWQRCYDWMDTDPMVVDHFLRTSFLELMQDPVLHDIMDTSMQNITWKLIRHLPIVLKTLKAGPMTFIHADCRIENMMWPKAGMDAKDPRLHFDEDTITHAGLEFDNVYDREMIVWHAHDWQTSTKGVGVYDLAYFVSLSLNIADVDQGNDSCDRKLVEAYHRELLRHSATARDAGYSLEQCWYEYRLSMFLALFIPIAILRPGSIGNAGVERLKTIRIKMLERCVKSLRRVSSGEILEELINSCCQHRTSSTAMFDMLPNEIDDKPTSVVLPTHEIMLYHLPVEVMANDVNSYDRWFLNGYSRQGDMFFAAAFGMYPKRGVVDASFSVVLKGVQHNVRASRPYDSVRDDPPLKGSSVPATGFEFQYSVGPIRIVVREPLRKVDLQVILPNEGIRANLSFTARFPAKMEPHYSFNLKGAGKMEYDRLTQLVTWDGFIDVNNATIKVESWFGTRDRSWGVRPHPSADKPASKNWQRNHFLANQYGRSFLNFLVSTSRSPQFFWFWCPMNLESSGILYHSQQDRFGGLQNGSASVLGGNFVSPRFHETRAIDAAIHSFDPVERRSTRAGPDAVQVHIPVVSAGHQYVFLPGTRHLKESTIDIHLEDDRKIQIRLEPLFPFFMSGVGYGHPSWGHGMKHQGSSFTATYDRIDTEMVDRNNPLYWHIQEVCKVTATIGNHQIETGIGTMEQLIVGPHQPSNFTSLYDTTPLN